MPPANKALTGSNYSYERGPDPLNLREVGDGSNDPIFGNHETDDSEVQDVADTVEDASDKGQHLDEYGEGIVSSVTRTGKHSQTARRNRQRQRQTGFNIGSVKKSGALLGLGVLVGGYMFTRGE